MKNQWMVPLCSMPRAQWGVVHADGPVAAHALEMEGGMPGVLQPERVLLSCEGLGFAGAGVIEIGHCLDARLTVLARDPRAFPNDPLGNYRNAGAG